MCCEWLLQSLEAATHAATGRRCSARQSDPRGACCIQKAHDCSYKTKLNLSLPPSTVNAFKMHKFVVVLLLALLCAAAQARELKQAQTVQQALQAAQGTRVSTLLSALQVGRGGVIQPNVHTWPHTPRGRA